MIAQTVAEIVSKGYRGMPVQKMDRTNRVLQTPLMGTPPKYIFREYKGGAIAWEKVRKMAEEHAGYTIHDMDVGEVAHRIVKYGVEALGSLEKDDASGQFIMNRMAFLWPSAYFRRTLCPPQAASTGPEAQSSIK